MDISTIEYHLSNHECKTCNPSPQQETQTQTKKQINSQITRNKEHLIKFEKYKKYLIEYDSFPKNNNDETYDLWTFGLSIMSSLKGLKKYYKNLLQKFKIEIEEIVQKSSNLTDEWSLFMCCLLQTSHI